MQQTEFAIHSMDYKLSTLFTYIMHSIVQQQMPQCVTKIVYHDKSLGVRRTQKSLRCQTLIRPANLSINYTMQESYSQILLFDNTSYMPP